MADDLAAAIEYYDGIADALGKRFRAAVRRRLDTIAARPASYGRVHGEQRAAMLERFPYIILFESGADTVTILGVFHAASDPQRWRERSAPDGQ